MKNQRRSSYMAELTTWLGQILDRASAGEDKAQLVLELKDRVYSSYKAGRASQTTSTNQQPYEKFKKEERSDDTARA